MDKPNTEEAAEKPVQPSIGEATDRPVQPFWKALPRNVPGALK